MQNNEYLEAKSPQAPPQAHKNMLVKVKESKAVKHVNMYIHVCECMMYVSVYVSVSSSAINFAAIMRRRT